VGDESMIARHRPRGFARPLPLWLRAGAMLIAAQAPRAHAGDIVYDISVSASGASVLGTITTDGTLGLLNAPNILAWNLTVASGPESINLTNVGGQSLLLFGGHDLTATPTQLQFNYAGTDGGYFAFQASNPGEFSGYHYWTNNTTWFAAYQRGMGIVPGAYNDAYAVFVPETGALNFNGGPSVPMAAVQTSIHQLAHARTAQVIVGQLQSQLLTGLNEQVSCGNCGGTNINFGSEAMAGHGRVSLASDWTLLGGADLGRYDSDGVDVQLSEGFSGALQWDRVEWGTSRPFAEVGVSAARQNVDYHRTYASGTGPSTATGSTRDYDYSASFELGWVNRLTPRDEVAAYLSYTRDWQVVGAYSEGAGGAGGLNAAVGAGTDTLNAAGLQLQYTHLFGRYFEGDLNGGARYAFNPHSGLQANVSGVTFSGDQNSFVYYDVGTRLGVRVQDHLTVDLYVDAVLAPQAIGSSVHGGFGLRWVY